MKYNEIDFLEQFDEHKKCNYEVGPFVEEYNMVRGNDYINIILFCYEDDEIYISVNSVSLKIHKVKEIICDKSQQSVVQFLFFKRKQEYPIVILQVKPEIALRVDIEQVGSRIIPK